MKSSFTLHNHRLVRLSVLSFSASPPLHSFRGSLSGLGWMRKREPRAWWCWLYLPSSGVASFSSQLTPFSGCQRVSAESSWRAFRGRKGFRIDWAGGGLPSDLRLEVAWCQRSRINKDSPSSSLSLAQDCEKEIHDQHRHVHFSKSLRQSRSPLTISSKRRRRRKERNFSQCQKSRTNTCARRISLSQDSRGSQDPNWRSYTEPYFSRASSWSRSSSPKPDHSSAFFFSSASLFGLQMQ